MNRREALAALLALPSLVTTAAAAGPEIPAAPTWASDWSDAAARMASMEEMANRQQLPRTQSTLCYASAIQFSPDVFLIFGMRGLAEYLGHLTSGKWEVLGHGVSRRGAAWGIFVQGVLADDTRAELLAADQARSRQYRRAELALWKASRRARAAEQQLQRDASSERA